jgi:hypothetical protein
LFQGLPNFLVYLAPRFKQLRDERLWPWIQNNLSVFRTEESGLSHRALRLSQISRTSHDSENKTVLNMLRELDEEMEDDEKEEEEMEEDDEKEEKQIEADADEEAKHNGASHAYENTAVLNMLRELDEEMEEDDEKEEKQIEADADEEAKQNDASHSYYDVQGLAL